MKYFSNESIPEDQRRNIAFQTVVVHRDLLQLANKQKQPPTYDNALALLHDVSLEAFKEVNKLVTSKNESELIRYYRDIAEINTIEGKIEITALDLIEEEIKKLEYLLKKDPSKKTIKSKLLEHKVAKEKLEPIRLTENRILNRDYSRVDRSDYATKCFEDDHFTDFKLNNKDILRIRFLHPDHDEHITGADLIYEQYDLKNEKGRFVFLQYKVWEKGVLYMSQNKNLAEQMEKMRAMVCDQGYCCSKDGAMYSNRYRLPYCSAFVRPTDKIQVNDSKLMSSGYHLPLCASIQLAGEFGKIAKEQMKGQSFSSKIFEELFNENMLGSRWMSIDEMEEFYRNSNIFNSVDRIKLYAREILKAG